MKRRGESKMRRSQYLIHTNIILLMTRISLSMHVFLLILFSTLIQVIDKKKHQNIKIY